MKKRHIFRNIVLICILIGIIYFGYNYVRSYDSLTDAVYNVGSNVRSFVYNFLDQSSEVTAPRKNQNANASTKAVTSKEDEELLKGAVSYTVSSQEKNSEFSNTAIDGLKIYQYGKTLLNDDEKEIYVQIEKALKEITPKIKIESKCNYKTFSKVYSYVVQDHSEVYYLKQCQISYLEEGGIFHYILQLVYEYDNDKSVIDNHNKEIAKVAAEVINKANTMGSDYKKEKYIHDYIVKNCKYDKQAAENIDLFSDSKGIYGVFINKKAICGGYSSALHVLLSSVGIKSVRIIGEAQGGPHAWNVVNVNSKWKYVDTTFDDPISVDQNGKELSVNTLQHTYFNYTDEKGHNLYEFNEDDPFDLTSGNYLSLPSVS